MRAVCKPSLASALLAAFVLTHALYASGTLRKVLCELSTADIPEGDGVMHGKCAQPEVKVYSTIRFGRDKNMPK